MIGILSIGSISFQSIFPPPARLSPAREDREQWIESAFMRWPRRAHFPFPPSADAFSINFSFARNFQFDRRNEGKIARI